MTHPTRKFDTVPEWADEYDYNTTTTVTTRACSLCGGRSRVVVPTDDLESWRSGTLIQNAFPYFTPAERELLMTGTHSECWDAFFGDEE
jgi:hypothetical protein